VKLNIGQKAPDFNAIDQDGKKHSLLMYKGKWILLYFYPKDDTPGCTIEANQFTEHSSEFNELDTIILGVSKDSCDSHQDFIQKYGIPFELLADEAGDLCEQYGVWQEKEKNGIKKKGIVRSTFIINKKQALSPF